MPHVLRKLASGKTDEEKKQIAHAITKVITEVLQCHEKFVSVVIEDVDAIDWMEKVYGRQWTWL